jgi:hypothetical protein
LFLYRRGVTTLRLGTTFGVEVSGDEALARAERYLRAVGYQVERGSTGQLTARRGSAALTRMALSPRSWGAEVTVTVVPGEGNVHVKSTFSITTDGQVASIYEGEFWREEVLGLERAVCDGTAESGASRRLARRAVAMNLASLPVLMGVWLAPVAAAVIVAPPGPWGTLEVVTALAAAATGLGVAIVVGRNVFGIFAEPKEMPYLKE